MRAALIISLLFAFALNAEKLSEKEVDSLSERLLSLKKEVMKTQKMIKGKEQEKFLPDVEVFSTMLDLVITSELGIEKKHKKLFLSLLDEGLERASLLQSGKTPWTTKKGLVIRGYRSKLDDTCQPFVVRTNEGYPNSKAKAPLFINFPHAGKREPMSFLSVAKKVGKTFADENAFHLEVYARGYTTGKFAGETAVFEEIKNTLHHYPVDKRRLIIHGFSNGGSATWHFAAHYPHLWNAASPGAGYPDSEIYMRVSSWDTPPPWYEMKLFKHNSATDIVSNLKMLPTYSYVGEHGAHRFAHDHIIREAAKQGLSIKRILGPKTGHRYEAKSKEVVRKWLLDKVAKRTHEPENIHYSTYSLRYNKCHWLEIDQLIEHWQKSTVNIERLANDSFQIDTANIAQFTLDLEKVYNLPAKLKLIINGYPLDVESSGKVTFSRREEAIKKGRKVENWFLGGGHKELTKVHGLSGPIDDFLYDRSINVFPTYKGNHASVDNWIKNELQFAKNMWHLRFNGRAIEKADKNLTHQDIASSNLVLWGSSQSNKILKEIISKLPIQWTANELIVNGRKYDAKYHVPVMIYPNPLNPKKYVVLNSGFTCRSKGGTSANFTAKLPDWAVVDIREPASEKAPGKVVDAGFFDENWKFKRGENK